MKSVCRAATAAQGQAASARCAPGVKQGGVGSAILNGERARRRETLNAGARRLSGHVLAGNELRCARSSPTPVRRGEARAHTHRKKNTAVVCACRPVAGARRARRRSRARRRGSRGRLQRMSESGGPWVDALAVGPRAQQRRPFACSRQRWLSCSSRAMVDAAARAPWAVARRSCGRNHGASLRPREAPVAAVRGSEVLGHRTSD